MEREAGDLGIDVNTLTRRVLNRILPGKSNFDTSYFNKFVKLKTHQAAMEGKKEFSMQEIVGEWEKKKGDKVFENQLDEFWEWSELEKGCMTVSERKKEFLRAIMEIAALVGSLIQFTLRYSLSNKIFIVRLLFIRLQV